MLQADDNGSNVLCKTFNAVNTYTIITTGAEQDNLFYTALKAYLKEVDERERLPPAVVLFNLLYVVLSEFRYRI